MGQQIYGYIHRDGFPLHAHMRAEWLHMQSVMAGHEGLVLAIGNAIGTWYELREQT